MTSRRKPVALAVLILVAGVLAAGLHPAHGAKRVLALFNLRPTNMEAMDYSGEIIYAFISALENTKGIELMPRREMEEALFKASLVQSDVADQVAEAGKVLGVHYILFGQVTYKAAAILTRMQLMDVARGRVVKTWTPQFRNREAINARIPKLTSELVRVVVSGAMRPTGTALAAGQPSSAAQGQITKLKAVADAAEVSLRWQWTGAPPSGFHVYRAEAARGPYALIGRAATPKYTDGKLKKGKTYHYRIGVVAASGAELKRDTTASVEFTGEKQPYPPLVMESSGHVRRMTVEFVPALQNEQENFDIRSYTLHRREAGSEAWQEVATITSKDKSEFDLAFKVVDPGPLKDGVTYEYALSSLDRKKRKSPLSDPVAVATIARPVLEVARDLMLRQVDLKWAAEENVDGYRLYRKDPQGDWAEVATVRGAAKNKHVDKKKLADGLTYAYRLTVFDDKNESGPSEVVIARTKPLPPPPTGLTARSGMVKSVQLAWTPLTDADIGGYAIFRGVSPDRLERITKISGRRKDAYLDKGSGFENLEDGVTYHYAIEAYNRHGADGELSALITARTKPRPRPVAGLSAAASGDRIRVGWQPNAEADIDVYLIYRSRNAGNWYKVEEVKAAAREYLDDDLNPGETYRYRLVARDADGLQSDPSDSETVASPLVEPTKG